MDEFQENPPEITCSGGISIPLMTTPEEVSVELKFDAESMREVIRRHGEVYQKLHDEGSGF